MEAMLVGLDGRQSVRVDRDWFVIGRSPGCDLWLENPSVSRRHCGLVRSGDALWVVDLGSANGTRVNGRRLASSPLRPGDELAVAHLRFRVEAAGSGVRAG